MERNVSGIVALLLSFSFLLSACSQDAATQQQQQQSQQPGQQQAETGGGKTEKQGLIPATDKSKVPAAYSAEALVKSKRWMASALR